MARVPTCDSSSRASRWRPTPEQLMVLQELFIRRGVKTPSTQLIERITQQLKLFGKVETKNVFYWFQNHKAREKQKLRKKLLNCYYYFQPQQHLGYGHRSDSEAAGCPQQQHQANNVFYYCMPPPQQQSHVSGFLPFIPAATQITSAVDKDEVIEIGSADAASSETNSLDQTPCNGVINSSSTVFPDHHHTRHNDHNDERRSLGGLGVITLLNDAVLSFSCGSRQPPKTLQLFPTTPESPTSHDAVDSTTTFFSSSSLSLSISS